MRKNNSANLLKSPLIALAILILISVSGYSQIGQVTFFDTTEYVSGPSGLNTNLCIASSKGYVSEIHRLVKRGADFNYLDEFGISPVCYAAINNKRSALIALLSYDPKLDTYTYQGESALHIATRENYLEISELLIRKNSNINIRDNYNCTPLHYAAIYNYIYMSDLLIYYNADLDLQSKDGTTPLMAAVWAGNAEVTDILIQAGANVNIPDNNGFTALLIAAQNTDTLITKMLLDAGAQISDINKFNYDIASIAARTGDDEYTQYVLEETDWKKDRNPESIDPISVARRYGKNNLYKFLRLHRNGKKESIGFDMVQISLNSKFCFRDIYTGGEISFIEPLNKFRINAGFEYKPWYTRVLVKENESLYYQYHDKRYLFRAGAGKEFVIMDNYFRGKTSLILNLNLGYMIAEYYKGTYEKPANKVRFMPSIMFERSYSNFIIGVGYEYMNADLHKAGPNWVKLSAAYNFSFSNNKAPLKNIPWY